MHLIKDKSALCKGGNVMKYIGKPAGMWVLFAGSFEKHLTVEFDLTAE